MRNSSASLGTRRYNADCPRLQAYCASAQASHDLPEPVGPVTSTAVPSSTQRDSARLIKAGRSKPRPARPSTSSMQACGYFSRARLSSAAWRLSARWYTSRSTISASRSSKLKAVLAVLESCSSTAVAMPTSLSSRSCARVLFIIMVRVLEFG